MGMTSEPPVADPVPGRDLAAFVAAVDTGTVQGAADALVLTQSAASKRILALERRMGARLLVRTSTGVRPTAQGQALYPAARVALDALAEAERALAPLGAGGTLLRIAASQTVGELLLPAWLAELRLGLPDVHPRVEIVNSPTVLERVRAGDAEIGFVEGPDPLHRLDVLRVARDRLVVIVARDHPWARRRSIAPGELAGAPYFARERGSGTRAVAAEALRPAGVELEPVLELSSLQSLKRALLRGGFTIISELAVEEEVRAGTLHRVPVRGLAFRRDLRAVRRDRRLTAPARALWAWLERRPAA